MGYLVGPISGNARLMPSVPTARLGSLGEKILTAVGSAQMGNQNWKVGDIGTSGYHRMPKQPRSDFESWQCVKTLYPW